MIGLDTNILVRYLTQDDPIQSAKAREIVERRLTEEKPGFVSIVAMVETVWVLQRAYGLRPHEIVGAVERMLQTDVLVVENEQEVFTAMIALKEGQGSFADAVIAALGARVGCSSHADIRPASTATSRFRTSLNARGSSGKPIKSFRSICVRASKRTRPECARQLKKARAKTRAFSVSGLLNYSFGRKTSEGVINSTR